MRPFQSGGKSSATGASHQVTFNADVMTRVVCGWCDRPLDGLGPITEGQGVMGLSLSHGICAECEAAVLMCMRCTFLCSRRERMSGDRHPLCPALTREVVL